MYIYIHGFNSSVNSSTHHKLKAIFPETYAVTYPSSGLFAANLQGLVQQVMVFHEPCNAPLVLVGSSLGGFYTSHLAAFFRCPCALFNPVVNPFETMKQFIGPQQNLHTYEPWKFTQETLESYKDFSDTRKTPIKRFVVLGRNDELLNPANAKSYWRVCAEIYETDDHHSIATLDPIIVAALKRLHGDS